MITHHLPDFTRRRLRAALVAATLAASQAGLAAVLAPPPAFRAPFTPTSDAEVLQDVPAATDPNVVAIHALRARFDRAPSDRAIAERLASAYIDFGRELGDAHYVGYAEAVIAPWMAKPAPPASVLVLQATILQYRHRFEPARQLLKRATATDPRNAQAWLTLATLDMVQGDYASATTDCQQVGQTGGFVLGTICSANLVSYLGQAQRSVAVLQGMLRESRGAPPSTIAWIEGLIAESSERLGDWPAVEAHYRSALEATPHDNFLLVAYADFLLDRDRPQEVIALLTDYAQSDTAYLRLVLAEAALHSPDLARYNFVMAARFEALAQRGEDLFGREQVRFALHAQHDAAAALELAEQNWKVQRAPWDVRVFLEAARAAHRPDAAIPVLDFVDRTRLEDSMIRPLAAQLRAQTTPIRSKKATQAGAT